MPTPVSADKFLAALRAEGVDVVEVGSWRTHNRNHKGSWGPVHGTMIHHTVSKGSAYTVALCRDGYAPELPGPLCHGVITKDGRVHLVGYGRTNHAGGGDPDTLAAVISENYGDAPPRPDRGNSDGVDGNRHFYGFECENLGDGKDPWPDAQLDAIERVSAAICRLYGWSAKSVVGHLEWSDDKSDPRGFTMKSMRERIAARLGDEPDGDGGGTPPSGDEFPGASQFGPGANNAHVTRLGQMLVARGGGRFYSEGPGPRWSEADRSATSAFQRAQGWSGADADGIPGPATWDLLVSGRGNSIPAAVPAKPVVSVSAVADAARRDPGAAQGATSHPAHVRPVELALARLGYLADGYSGDGSFGSRTVAAYAAWQRSQGHRGTAADGIPGKSSLSALGARTGLFTVTN